MFGLGFDKKTIYIILIILVGMMLINMGTEGLLRLLLTIPGIFIALTFHEFAHAYTAYKLGDETPKLQGRMNLNPISHIDPIGFIFLITAGFGWGKPVQIDSRNFNGKYSISKAEAIVSAAGPIINFILAFIFFIIYYAMFYVANLGETLSTQVSGILASVILYTVSINIGLGVFNLIPLPPLDGSKILMHFLPAKGKQWFYNNTQIFYIVFLLIWITGLASNILSPIFQLVFNGMQWVVVNIFKIFI